MYQRNQYPDFANYPYVPPVDPSKPVNPLTSINSMSSRSNFQYDFTPQRTVPSFYSTTTLIPTYTSECFQRLYQAPTSLNNLADPGWAYDDISPPVNYQANLNAMEDGSLPTNPILRSSVSDTRLATASTMREQLLTDILRDMGDINEEISSMEGHFSKSRQEPLGYAPVINDDLPEPNLNFEQSRYLSRPSQNYNDLQINSNWN
ncbi:unnamed protein product [Adineta steineri]|uniref:Uncharacterized protein n=1 Tax=Adineta steineri TaxID=433720 RepID=A0A818USM3_9BILA|nr:unnamed protein product [Adineta steineri]CAF1545813.1 unnamed protein product [Adineta steineri]CAF3697061.1 unnamed protein product [Adineta steineri]